MLPSVSDKLPPKKDRNHWGRWKTEVARYGQAYKDRIVARLLPPESAAVEQASREGGVSVATLERWRADALANGSGAGSPRWTAVARLQAVIITAAMDEATRSGRGRPVRWKPGRIAGGSRNWSGSFIARTRHWPKRPPCLCSQKNWRRSSTKARTYDPPSYSATVDRHPADDPLAPGRHRPSSAAACRRRCPPEHRPGRAGRRPRRLVQCHAPGSGGLPNS